MRMQKCRVSEKIKTLLTSKGTLELYFFFKKNKNIGRVFPSVVTVQPLTGYSGVVTY